MKGAILSFFEGSNGGGHGFVKELTGDRRQFFFHTSNSPDLDQITHIGMKVDFEVRASTKRTWGEEAVNLKNIETDEGDF